MRGERLRQQEELLVTALTKLEVAEATYLPLLNCVDWQGPVQSLYASAIGLLRKQSTLARGKLADALAATRWALASLSEGE